MRYGSLGQCAACQHSIASHFDTFLQWQGCLVPTTQGMAFTLVPVPVVVHNPNGTVRRQRPKGYRQFTRAAYRALLPPDQRADDVDGIAPNRRIVLDAILTFNREHKIQPVTGDLVQQTGMGRGSVSESLKWLRDKKLIEAKNMDEARFAP